jgi:hypothetical protein
MLKGGERQYLNEMVPGVRVARKSRNPNLIRGNGRGNATRTKTTVNAATIGNEPVGGTRRANHELGAGIGICGSNLAETP